MSDYIYGIERVKLYEKVIDRIKELLACGELKKGDRLPSSQELGKRFGVSRIVIREALRLLENMGIVEIVPGKGTFIRSSIDLDVALNDLEYTLRSSHNLILNLVEFREILEPGIAALSAQRRKEEEIKLMESTLKEMEEEVREGKTGTNPSLKFHLLIAKSTKNPIFVRVMLTLGALLRESREVSLRLSGRGEKAIDEHYRILEAIKRKDSEEAKKAMEEHMKNLKSILLDKVNLYTIDQK